MWQGRIVLDKRYEEIARQRTEQSSIRSRTVQPYVTNRDDTITRLGIARNLVKAQTARTKVRVASILHRVVPSG